MTNKLPVRLAIEEWLPRAALCLVTVFCVAAMATIVEATQTGEDSLNTRLVGTNDLQARSAYQPLPIQQGDRRILYVGHHGGEQPNPLTGETEQNGVSVVDVTDAAHPEYLHHIPPTGEARGSQMVQVCSGADLPQGEPGKWYLLRTNGGLGHEIWDVTEPASPTFVTTVAEMGMSASREGEGEVDTHKHYWECATGIAYLIGSADGWWSSRILQVFDLSNPTEPRRIRNFSLVGVEPSSTMDPTPSPNGIHEPFSMGNRVYIAYGTGSSGTFQIVDREKLLKGDPNAADPFAPTAENLSYPVVGELPMPYYWGAHTAWPMPGMDIPDYAADSEGGTRDIAVLVSEATANECQQARHVAWFVDMTDEAHPFPISSFQVPESSGNFCDRGGRFGPHASQWSTDPLFYKKLVILSWFNAGARVVDVRDPFHPKEVGFYIPATTSKTAERCATIDGQRRCKVAIQTNNVEVDDRGFIYLVDRANTGVHIIELTGPAKEILTAPASD